MATKTPVRKSDTGPVGPAGPTGVPHGPQYGRKERDKHATDLSTQLRSESWDADDVDNTYFRAADRVAAKNGYPDPRDVTVLVEAGKERTRRTAKAKTHTPIRRLGSRFGHIGGTN